MEKAQIIEHYMTIDGLNDFEYLLYKILFHSAPTFLAGKASSLICFKKSKQNRNLFRLWEEYKGQVAEIVDFPFYELKRGKDYIIVLFYDKDRIEAILHQTDVQLFMKNYGYSSNERVIKSLARLRLHYTYECPHEIGIFLGYPLHDVQSFLDPEDKEVLWVGYWKVYSELEEALIAFADYDEARGFIMDSVEKGIEPSQLLRQMFRSVQREKIS